MAPAVTLYYHHGWFYCCFYLFAPLSICPPMKQTDTLKGLAKRLVTDQLLEENVAVQALAECESDQSNLVHYLTHNNLLDPSLIAAVAANEFGTPLYDLSAHNIEASPKELVEKKLIRKHQVLPLFKRANRLFLAVSDPTNHQAVSEVRFQTGLSVGSLPA
jgi:type IV pilus assembly protein PilB